MSTLSENLSIDSSKALSAQKQINRSDYDDWSTSPLGLVVKDRLAGKVALITGASAGIGAVTARRLAAEGAKVVLFARREDKLARIVDAIKRNGGEAAYLVGDVASEADNKNLVDFVVKLYGGLHIAFNNAGIIREWGTPVWANSATGFHEQLATNSNSIFFAVKYQAPVISRSGGGAIINNGSVGAFHWGRAGAAVYAASKCFVLGFTKNAATDLAKIGVRVNTVSPGATISDAVTTDHKAIEEMGKNNNAIGRVIKPEEIAAAVAYLASDEARAITGIDLLIDGGDLIAEKSAAPK